MLTLIKVRNMLEMQTAMNAKVNPEWLDAAYPFLRASVIEGAEAIEHAGWKWWKHQVRDQAQLQMELVDIIHFWLSAVLMWNRGNVDASVHFVMEDYQANSGVIAFDGQEYYFMALDVVSKLELLIGLSVSRRISLPLFSSLLGDCEMTWDDLYRQYVGKNTLNFFRQDNGYKQGTYQKLWAGREDNEHLAEILLGLDPQNENFRVRLYGALLERYSAVCGDSR